MRKKIWYAKQNNLANPFSLAGPFMNTEFNPTGFLQQDKGKEGFLSRNLELRNLEISYHGIKRRGYK